MFYEDLKKYVTGVHQFRGVVTIYDITNMPHNSISEKIEVVIRIMSIVNGIQYSGITMGMDKKERIVELQYQQTLSSCVTYANKPEMCIGFLFKLLKMLCLEINIIYPKNIKPEILGDLINSQPNGDGIRDFSKLEQNKLTDDDIKEMEVKKNTGGYDGSTDLDWTIAEFKLSISDIEDRLITNRIEYNVLKNDELHHIIKGYVDTKTIDAEILYIYNNIERIKSTSRRTVLQRIGIACIFGQPYTKYERLVDAFNNIHNLSEDNLNKKKPTKAKASKKNKDKIVINPKK